MDKEFSENYISKKWIEKNGERKPRIDEIINSLIKLNELRIREKEGKKDDEYLNKLILQQSETIMALFTLLGFTPYDNLSIE